ncbi:25.3 kDa vesicle transport protein [Acorus calamus]|uniref:25.3 kDa vesicle transport protein n=2 Tax=Acorus TaxID=4464 RepID=A0AAV9CAX8_ACOCL|nr:25.3 kDa vesicle transport protein [Acorus calamus]
MADEAKAKGNAAFSSGHFEEAIGHFTDAINLAPTNHVLYSNRSAAYASLHRYSDALSDAQKTVDLKPDWSKAYSRLGAAHFGLGNHADAVAAYKKGLEIDPNNQALKSALADAEASFPRRGQSSPFGNVFNGPDVWAKLTADPRTRGYLNQPDFLKMMQEVQRNPNNMNAYLSDQRMMDVLGVLLNVNLRTATPEEMGRDVDMGAVEKEKEEVKKKAGKVVGEEKVKEGEAVEEMEVEGEEREKRERKAEAQREKEKGNVAYKKKDFETAIGHYSRALELDDEDISFLTNRAAVYLEMGKQKYPEAVKHYTEALRRNPRDPKERGMQDPEIQTILSDPIMRQCKMVKLTMIARVTDGLPLAEGLDDGRDQKDADIYKQQAKMLFKNLSKGQNVASRMSIETGPYVFYYIIEGRVCYLTMCDRSYPKKLAFQYLEDLKNEFERVNGGQIETASRPYAFIKFDTFIQKTKKLYLDTRTQRNLAKLNDELYEVHQIMTRNVQEVLGVGEKLDQVSQLSSRLTSESRIYADKAKDLNRQALIRKWAPVAIVIGIVLLLFWVKMKIW